jgi:hypothetical protein
MPSSLATVSTKVQALSCLSMSCSCLIRASKEENMLWKSPFRRRCGVDVEISTKRILDGLSSSRSRIAIVDT